MDGIRSVLVVRVSATRIAAAEFFSFSSGTMAWAKANGHDRIDYPEVRLVPGIGAEELYALILGVIKQTGDLVTTLVVIGVPGPVFQGEVLFSPTLQTLTGDLRGYLVKQGIAHRQIAVFNNTDLAANASLQNSRGAVRKHQLLSALIVSVGSGIGSAWVIAGKVRLGDGGLAGELGHVVIHPDGPECVCGHRGCLELYYSGRALQWFAGERGIKVEQATDLLGIPAAAELLRQVVPLDVSGIVLSGNLLPIYSPAVMGELINQARPSYMSLRKVVAATFQPMEGVLLGGAYVGFALAELAPYDFTTR